MKKFALIVALLAGATTVSAQVPVYTTPSEDVMVALALAKAARDRATPVVPVKATTAQTVTIPPGFHAHTRTDGTVIVHSDALLNDPVAHQGVPYPWHKTATAGQTVVVNSAPVQTAAPPPVSYRATTSFTQQSCPNGNCPTVTSSTSRVVTGDGWYLGKNLGR